MREGEWGYTVSARCALSDAVALMSDVERLGELHPLVTGVRPVERMATALRSYRVTDWLRWGPVRFPVRYRVDVMSQSDLEVVTAARQRPFTTLWTTAQFQVEGDVVHLSVRTVLRAPTLLFPYAFRTGRAAHMALADRVREVLEARGCAR